MVALMVALKVEMMAVKKDSIMDVSMVLM